MLYFLVIAGGLTLAFRPSAIKRTPFTVPNFRTSVGLFASMIVEELLIDRFAFAKPFLDAVPELSTRLAQLPAKVNLDAFEHGREIDQSYVQVLDHAAKLLNLF